jgi:ABC-2 type transport system ATP-binding protein
LSSHLLSDVEDVCNRVVIYYGGKVQAMGTLKELLATPDEIRITTPTLPRETMERLLAIIRKDVAEEKVRIDTPTQNLERYFLDVVQNARQAAAETSGAMSGARVAAYLRGELQAKPASDRILDRLTAPQASAPVTPAMPSPVSSVSQQRLDALAKPAEASSPLPAATPAAAKPLSAEELRKADEKLASLVKK